MSEAEYGERIVRAARCWIGTPYLHQASLKGAGCDCLGLLRGVWREIVGAEPEELKPYSSDWAEAGGQETLLEAAQRYLAPGNAISFSAGDVLLFRWRPDAPSKHVAIASSGSSMIHAHEGAAVCEIAIHPVWRRKISHAFRFPPPIN